MDDDSSFLPRGSACNYKLRSAYSQSQLVLTPVRSLIVNGKKANHSRSAWNGRCRGYSSTEKANSRASCAQTLLHGTSDQGCGYSSQISKSSEGLNALVPSWRAALMPRPSHDPQQYDTMSQARVRLLRCRHSRHARTAISRQRNPHR